MPQKNPIRFLRSITLVEGVSFLVLLFVAMPLKYMGGIPWPVTVVGWIHGALFILVCIALLNVKFELKWPLGRTMLVLLAALLPFGPFVIDRRLKRYEAELGSTSVS